METYSFGEWLKKRRKHLRLTQREVATAVYCSTAMIKKIEADERQPSVELAQALATTLQIPSEKRDIFVECARGKRPLDFLAGVQGSRGAEENFFPLLPRSSAPLPTPTTPFISSDFLEFGDTLDSLLHAGLVAHAQSDWQTAVAFFGFFEGNLRGYVTIRPLREKVKAAQSAIQATLSPAAYAEAVAQAQQKTLDELLAIWLA